MVLEFITKRNTYGSRRWLRIDTEKRTFCRVCPRMIPEGVEVTRSDYEALVEECIEEQFAEV